MKSSETKTATSSHHSQQDARTPFFQKDGEGTFFSENVNEVLSPQAAEPFFSPNNIQPKLKIGEPNDQYEKEADATAERVVRKMPNIKVETSKQNDNSVSNNTPTIQKKAVDEDLQMKEEGEEISMKEMEVQRKPIFESNEDPPGNNTVQRKISQGFIQKKGTPEEEESVMAKSDNNTPTVSSGFQSQLNSSKGGGNPLPKETRSSMESGFGADFGNVRIHTGSEAAEMSQSIDAQAFTHSSDIYFNEGKYDIGSTGGQILLAHELTHTVQQGGGMQRCVQREISGNSNTNESSTVDSSDFNLTPNSDPKNNPWISADSQTDTEGNTISMDNSSRWYISEYPTNLNFPIADTFRYELLPINPNKAFYELLEKCYFVLEDMEAVSTGLRGDTKYWFARVYYYVTLFELDNILKGVYEYPHMKMQEVLFFYQTYKENLDNWINGKKDLVEQNWIEAFKSAEAQQNGDWLYTKSTELLKSLLPSIEAHIRFDLPRAIAAAYLLYYNDIPNTSIMDFKKDFFKMSSVFESANTALTKEIDQAESAWRVLDPTSYNWLQDAFFPDLFNIKVERESAWEKATVLAEMAENYDFNINYFYNSFVFSSEEYFGGMLVALMHMYMGTNMMPSGMEVNSSLIKDYRWLWFNQPGSNVLPLMIGPDAPILKLLTPPAFENFYFEPNRPFEEEMSGAYFGLDSLPNIVIENKLQSDKLGELALWSSTVRGAEVEIIGHASSEGSVKHNYDLALRRANLVATSLLWKGFDKNNMIKITSKGEDEAEKDNPAFRFVEIRVNGSGILKEQFLPLNMDLPNGKIVLDIDFMMNAGYDMKYSDKYEDVRYQIKKLMYENGKEVMWGQPALLDVSVEE